MAKAKPPVSFASNDPVLFLVPDMPVAGAPARDLTGADIEYQARVRALRVSGGIPTSIGQAEVDEVIAELEASGAFTRTAPPAAPAEE